MKYSFLILSLLLFVLLANGQRKKTPQTKAHTTQVTPKKNGKAQPAKTAQSLPKAANTQSKKTIRAKRSKQNTTSTKPSNDYLTPSIRGLQGQREAIKQQIRQQEAALRANQADVKKRMQNLLIINSEIDERKKSIEGIQKDITLLNGNIDILKSQLVTLEQQLNDHKTKYIKSMRYMARHRTVQENLMFIFSAKDIAQMYRRLRFVREYASYQKAQGELVKNKQEQINEKNLQLEQVRGQKNNLLYKDRKEHAVLQTKQDEQQKMVAGLQKQQRTIQTLIDEQRKKDAVLNAQIDHLIAIEVEKARVRAEAEARKKAEAAEAAKRKSEELARKKAAAEAAARENARRIAEAKAREEKLRAEAKAAAAEAERSKTHEAAQSQRAATERKAKAEQAAREAEAERKAVERKAEAERSRNEKEIAEVRKDADEMRKLSTVDRMLSGGFESNRGRLPMPITGSYRVVSHFGQYSVDGLKGVHLDNKGINIMGSAGCMARSIYDGEVSAVFGYGGTMVVMVRHGAYISVYCNLKSVLVNKGQKVSTRQGLGTVGADNILQFQLRKETAKLNPEVWLGR